MLVCSFCDGLYKYRYKDKIWYFEFSKMFGPALIDPDTYEITHECIPETETDFWEMFDEWYSLSNEDKEKYKLKD